MNGNRKFTSRMMNISYQLWSIITVPRLVATPWRSRLPPSIATLSRVHNAVSQLIPAHSLESACCRNYLSGAEANGLLCRTESEWRILREWGECCVLVCSQEVIVYCRGDGAESRSSAADDTLTPPEQTKVLGFNAAGEGEAASYKPQLTLSLPLFNLTTTFTTKILFFLGVRIRLHPPLQQVTQPSSHIPPLSPSLPIFLADSIAPTFFPFQNFFGGSQIYISCKIIEL